MIRQLSQADLYGAVNSAVQGQKWPKQVKNVDSTAVSIFVVILVELTNTETVVVSPSRALLNFQKATIQRGVLSGAFFL